MAELYRSNLIELASCLIVISAAKREQRFSERHSTTPQPQFALEMRPFGMRLKSFTVETEHP